MDGFINLLKPPGMTSSDAVVFVKKRLPRGTKVGHAGTLDPEAAGVLPIMIGRATRLSDYIMVGEKEYVCEIATGVSTDTQDAQGSPVGGNGIPATAKQLRDVLPRFTGDIMQTPSAYSALKVGGRRMCDIIRAGGEVAPQPRTVTISELRYLGESTRGGHMLRIRCSKGTYIRALCDDIGAALGCGAHMRFLMRTHTAGFDIDGAHTLEEIECDIADCMLPCDAPLGHMAALYADRALLKPIMCGNPLPAHALRCAEGENALTENAGEAPVRLYVDVSPDDAADWRFAGIMRRDGDEYRFSAMLLDTEGLI